MSDTGTREDRIMKGIGTLLFYGLIGLIFLLTTFGGSDGSDNSAGGSDVAWETYDITIDVREDGSMHVTEYQEIEFGGSYSVGFLEIPMQRIDSIDNVEVRVERGVSADAESVDYLPEDEPEGDLVVAEQVAWNAYEDEPNTFRAREEDGLFVIEYGFDPTSWYWMDSLNNTRTIVVEYDAHGVIRDYPDAEEPWQQFHWMAISDEVTAIAPVQSASVTVNLPEEVPAEDLVVAPEPDSQDGSSITWSSGRMDEGDSLDVQAAFPTITEATSPSWQEAADARDADLEAREARANAGRLMLMLAGIGIAVLGGLVLLYAWYRSIREPRMSPVHDRISEAPGDLPAVLVGALVDEEVHPRDIAAGVIDLNRQGVVAITEGSPEDSERYYLTLLKEIPSHPAWARETLQLIFGDRPTVGTRTGFSTLRRLFGYGRERLQQAIDQTLVDEGYYEELPETSRKHWTWVTNGFAVAAALLAIVILIWSQSWTLWALIPLVVGVALWFLGRKLTPHVAMKTGKGAEVAAAWRAFERHLGSSRFRELSPEWGEIQERYAPWLVAFGIESGWLHEMNRPPWETRRPGASTGQSGSKVSTWIWGDSSSSQRSTPSMSRGTHGPSPTMTPSRPSLPPMSSWRPTISSWDPGQWGDLQSASKRASSSLDSMSEGAFSMIGDMLEALGSSSGGGGSSSGGGSSFRGSSSRSGGGRSRSSSGGGRRGFR